MSENKIPMWCSNNFKFSRNSRFSGYNGHDFLALVWLTTISSHIMDVTFKFITALALLILVWLTTWVSTKNFLPKIINIWLQGKDSSFCFNEFRLILEHKLAWWEVTHMAEDLMHLPKRCLFTNFLNMYQGLTYLDFRECI